MFKDKIKSLIAPKEGDVSNKKKIENLVSFLVILIITVIIINVIWKDDSKDLEKENVLADKNKKLASSLEVEEDGLNISNMEKNLEDILTKINGVGKVKVMITYSKTAQMVPIYNTDSSSKNTEESDKQGGTRKVVETDTKTEIIYKEESGQKVPITQSIISPILEGAIITAEGANNASVKTNIIQAVEAVTGLATHKIQVFEMSEN